MGKMKPAGKAILIAGALGAVFAAKVMWWDKRPQEAKESTQVGQVVLPDAPEASLKGASAMLEFPQEKLAPVNGTKIVHYVMAWNSQAPLAYANGGARTTVGSLFASKNLNVEIVREDNCDNSLAKLVKFATDYKNDPSTPGVFCSYMGDGMPNFFNILVKQLEPLGPEYAPVAFYTMGKSNGEDGLWAPSEWRTNPRAAIGKTVACYLRDGDMNIALKWAGDNGIPVNPDETSYDSLALNLVASKDFLDAAEKYISGYTEARRIVRDGMKTADTKTVSVDAVATWTPGDVNIATRKGGLVRVASTKEYSTQMPNITIGIRKWLNDHRTDVESYIACLATAGDQVRSFTAAKKYACDVQAKIYNERDGSYWFKYYNGVTEPDVTGVMVELGGSMAFNLSDAVNFFGAGEDRIDRYKIVYTTFGDILSKMYPELMPDYPEYSKVVDKSFLMTVMSNHPELMQGEALKTEYAPTMTQEVSSRTYEILFETGSDRIKPESEKVLDEVIASVMVAEALRVAIHGHTDNVGDSQSNHTLSERRAASVAAYLASKGVSSRRIESAGFGEDRPVADNSTAAGRSKNRRVEVILGK